jgi:hypothetical protein
LEFVLKQMAKALLAQLVQLAQLAHLGSVNPTRLGSGSVNRPSPAPSLSSLSPRASLATPNHRRRRRLASPANSGGLRRRHLGRNTCLRALYHLHQTESSAASSPRRSGWSLLSGSAAYEHLWCRASPSWSLLQCLCFVCECRWKCQGVVLPVQLGEDFPRPRLVGRAGTASPCRPGMHLGVWWVWFFSSSSAFSSLASIAGHLAMNSCAKLTDLILWSCYWCKLIVFDSVSCCRAGSVMFMLWLFLCQRTMLTGC